MNKYEFLYKLGKSLETSSNADRQEIVHYYDELIQDAIDNGEPETEFIEKLGSIDKITRTIKKDSDFVIKNVKEKKDYQLQKVFDITVKVLGYGLYIVLVLTLGSIGFSLLTSGIGVFGYAAVQLYYAVMNGLPMGSVVLFSGMIALGLGLFVVGIAIFKWLVKESKNQLEKLMEFVQSKTKKEGQ